MPSLLLHPPRLTVALLLALPLPGVALERGDRIALVFESRGRTIEGTVTLTANPRVEVTTFETAGRPVSEAVRAFRAAWLGSKAAP